MVEVPEVQCCRERWLQDNMMPDADVEVCADPGGVDGRLRGATNGQHCQ